MATLLTESFEGASVGTTVSTANTAFDTLSNTGSLTFVFAASGVAGQCARIDATTAAACYGQEFVTLTGTLYSRCYYKVSAVPPTGILVLGAFVLSTGNNSHRIVVRTVSGVGRFTIQNGTTSVTPNSTISVPLDEWFRIEMGLLAGTGTVRIFTGANVHGTTPSDTLSTAVTQTTVDRIRFGPTAAASGASSVYMDEIKTDSADWVGPLVTIPPAGTVTYTMSGAALSDRSKVAAKLSGGSSIRVGYSTNSGLTSPSFTSASAPDSNSYVTWDITGLSPNTKYYYRYFDTPTGGTEVAIGSIYSFRTHTASASSDTVKIAVSSCVKTATTQATNAFGSIVTWDPHYFLHLGDAYYNGNTSTTDPADHRGRWETQIAAVPNWAACMAAVAQDYINSDHELNPDDADSNTTNASSFNLFYKQSIPARLVDTASTPVGKYRSWVDSNIRFILLDIRNTDRSPGANTDNSSKTMLGTTQKTWLKSELLEAEPLKVIISDVPWNGTASLANGIDKWWAYSTERQEIADFITSNSITVDFIHGDSHRIAVDATHNSWGGFPVICCSGLSQDGAGAEINGTMDSFFNNSGGAISTYMRLTYEWLDSTTIQRTASGWDAVADVERVNQVHTFDVAPPAEIVSGQVYKRVAGAWVPITMQKRVADAWQDSLVSKRVAGVWVPNPHNPAYPSTTRYPSTTTYPRSSGFPPVVPLATLTPSDTLTPSGG